MLQKVAQYARKPQPACNMRMCVWVCGWCVVCVDVDFLIRTVVYSWVLCFLPQPHFIIVFLSLFFLLRCFYVKLVKMSTWHIFFLTDSTMRSPLITETRERGRKRSELLWPLNATIISLKSHALRQLQQTHNENEFQFPNETDFHCHISSRNYSNLATTIYSGAECAYQW